MPTTSFPYKVKYTENPLSKESLHTGITIYYNPVLNPRENFNPNKVGILEESKNVPGAKGVWTAFINDTRRYFNIFGAEITSTSVGTTAVLYGVLSDGDLDPTVKTNKARGDAQETGESVYVSLRYMMPKDYFACEALNAIIRCMKDPLSMSDGTIATIAAKSYRIAEAMAKEAYNNRENDADSSSTGDYVDVSPTSLQTNTERILYNINSAIKANTESNVNTGIKIIGTPNVNVSNMLTEPVDVTIVP